MLEHVDDGAIEVRVFQRRRRDEQASFRRCRAGKHGSSLPGWNDVPFASNRRGVRTTVVRRSRRTLLHDNAEHCIVMRHGQRRHHRGVRVHRAPNCSASPRSIPTSTWSTPPATRRRASQRPTLYPSLAGAYPELVFEAFDVDRARGLDLVFLGLPHEASMALAPATGRPCRLRRRPLGRVPLEGPHAVPDVLRLRARPAGTAGGRRVRAARAVPRRAQGRRARRHARVLRHGRDAGPRAARGGGRDRAPGRDRRRRERRHGRRPQGRATTTSSRRSTRTSRPTGCSTHRHTPEMEQEIGAQILFTPHLAPMNRGILATCYARPAAGAVADRPSRCSTCYRARFAGEPFVVVTEDSPSTKATLGSNAVHVTARYDARTGYVDRDRRARQPRQGRLGRRRAVGQRGARASPRPPA